MGDMAGTVGERLALAMSVRRLKQAELARRAGVGQPAISRLLKGERGAQPKPETFGKIAESLSVPPAWLMLGAGPDPFATEPPAPVLTPGGGVRYSTRLAAGIAMRGVLDDQAIESMLLEEHSGSDRDPGPEFWIARARWYHEQRRSTAAQLADPRLDETPPMTGRPKKGKR